MRLGPFKRSFGGSYTEKVLPAAVRSIPEVVFYLIKEPFADYARTS